MVNRSRRTSWGVSHSGARPYSFCERIPPNPNSTRRIAPGTKGSYMVHGQGWKYINYADGVEYLFHLKEDIGDLRNLADEPRYASRKQEPRQVMEDLLKGTPCSWHASITVQETTV